MDKYIVRLPHGMRDRIAAAAKQHGRSMNAEIIAMIELGFDAATPNLSGTTDGDLLSEVVSRFDTKVQIIVAPNVAAEVGNKPTRAKAASK